MIQLAMVALMATLYYHHVNRSLDAAVVMLASSTVILNTVTQDYIHGAQGLVAALSICVVIVLLHHLPAKTEVANVRN